MPIPASRNSRLFYRAAQERFEDAQLLFKLNRTTAAVYLAGYSVECMIKSLILSAVPVSQEHVILAMFRGRLAHDYEWLIRHYRQQSGRSIPHNINQHLTRVREWSTDIRYSAATIRPNQAKGFLASVSEIITWADGRL